MKLFKLIFGFAIFLFSFNLVFSVTNINSCSNLIVGNETYVLTGDIFSSISTSCVNIYRSNIILDCNGYSIEGNYQNGDGIHIFGTSSNILNNITIKNCNVFNWRGKTQHLSGGNIVSEYTKNISYLNIETYNSSNGYGIFSKYSYGINNLTNVLQPRRRQWVI